MRWIRYRRERRAHCRGSCRDATKLVVDWVGRLSTEAVATEARVRDIKLLLQGVPKVEETAAEVVAGGEASRQNSPGEVRELRASLNGMAKAVTAGEMKTQKSDMSSRSRRWTGWRGRRRTW